MSIFDVTSNQYYASLSDAIQGSSSGDVIDLTAGAYSEYFPKITHDLTIQSVGGLAYLTTPSSPTNGMGILVVDANVTLSGLDISGAAVADGNGAGIRVETGSLVLSNSHIHNNQDGLLVNSGSTITVNVSHSEFDHNGSGDGYTHNIYINNIAEFTLTDSYIHDANTGHEIKSRAQVDVITGNRIQDQNADSSYSIDLPNGGNATITGNTFQKGPNTLNQAFVHFGGELYPVYSDSALTLSDNTFIADTGTGLNPTLVLNATNSAADQSGTATPATITGNTGYGIAALSQDLFSPADTTADNTLLPLSEAPALDTQSLFDVPEPPVLPLLAAVFALAVIVNRFRDRPRHRSAHSAP